jgi:DNA-binding CsgD family transcriptional regulator/PAS domain-containing protein
MDSERIFRLLIEKVYDAATNPDLWPTCLEAIAEAVNAGGTVLTIHDFHSQSGHISYGVRFDRAQGFKYDEYYATKNPYMLRGGEVITPGRVLTGEMILPFAEVKKTEYYNDYFAPAGLRYMLGGTLHEEHGAKSILTCLRTQGKQPFGATEIKMLQSAIPHLRRAMQVHYRLAGTSVREQVLLGALDATHVGFMLLDVHGKPLLFNKSAERILNSNDGLAIGKHGLVSAIHSQTREIEKVFHQALQKNGQAGRVVVARPSARLPYVLLVSPVSRAAQFPDQAAPSVVVLITDPEIGSEHPLDADILSRLFEFTPAECSVATQLVQGRSLHDAARELHISRNTARTHLKRLFGKTNTHRQAELLRVLAPF